MTHHRWLSLLLLICGTLLPVASQQQTPTTTSTESGASQQKARAALDQMITALGGAAYLNATDSYCEGRYGRFHNESMVAVALFVRYWKWPDKERLELTKDRDIIQIFDGNSAYEVTFRGVRPLNLEKEDQAKLHIIRNQHSLEVVLRSWLNEPGILLLDEGNSIAENKMAQKITLINSKNDAVSILISTDSHLPIEKIFTIRDPQSKDRDEEIEIYDNWRMIQGINTPFTVQTKHNGDIVRQQFLFKAAYNNRPADSFFQPTSVSIVPKNDSKKKK